MLKLKFFPFMAIFIHHLLKTSWALDSTIFPSVNETITWINNENCINHTVHFDDGSDGLFLLLKEEEGDIQFRKYYGFGFGFYCKLEDIRVCNLVILIVEMQRGIILTAPPVVVWSADSIFPVGENATLTLSEKEGMVFKDADGTLVWPVQSAANLSGLSIEKNGNLVIHNKNSGIGWQSFDFPVDTLLVGQSLPFNHQLMARSSSKNLGNDSAYLLVDTAFIGAYIDGTMYLKIPTNTTFLDAFGKLVRVTFGEKNLIFYYVFLHGPEEFAVPYPSSNSSSIQFLRLDADGGPRVYGWDPSNGWKVLHVFLYGEDECQFPLKCGTYGVCTKNQCSCPKGVDGVQYFSVANQDLPSLGCNILGSSPNTTDQLELVDFGSLWHFSYYDPTSVVPDLASEEDCREVCSRTSSCAGAFFYHYNNTPAGHCYMPSRILSVMGSPPDYGPYSSSSHIKVQKLSPPRAFSAQNHPPAFSVKKLLICTPIVAALSLSIICLVLLWKKRDVFFKKANLHDLMSATPFSFSYNELWSATGKFSMKLGGGGFGAVFKGKLSNGTLVAVKRLDNNGQGMKEFLAEVQTIGKIHHINLVRLVGFCIEKSYRLLVYEYLSNGSLDKWIFNESKDLCLSWNLRCKIILDIARGLAYLHEECRPKIAHLDVKPHNILIDNDFSAKISDFGLSKLIDKDKSQVITAMRGTLGYLAPEWQHSRVTVKADIYSFGIVLLEVVTGKKILDYSRPEPEVHLLSLLQKKAKGKCLINIVEQSEDKEHHQVEVVKMVRLGLWCLYADQRRRPPMSTVVKVLERMSEMEPDEITCDFAHVALPLLTSPVCDSSSLEASEV